MHGLNNKCERYCYSTLASICIFRVSDLRIENYYFDPLFFSK